MSELNSTYRSRNRGQVILLIALGATFLIGLAGLAVDLVLVYAVKTYLATAADSAAMGGVRALDRGVSYTDQEAEIERVTRMLFDANFPDDLLLTGESGRLSQQVAVFGSNMDPSAPPTFKTDPNISPGMREVRVLTEAQAPTFFMRMFGWGSVPVRASAYAARRDVNVMVVVDRSASLKGNNIVDNSIVSGLLLTHGQGPENSSRGNRLLRRSSELP